MKVTYVYAGLIPAFSVIGVFLSNYFIDLSFFQLNNEGIEIAYTKIAGPFNIKILFALSFGLIPVLFLFVFKLTKLNSFKQKFTTNLIIIFTGILFWQYRILNLTNDIDQSPVIGINALVDIDNLNLEIFFLFGLITGALISLLIFKLINRNILSKKENV